MSLDCGLRWRVSIFRRSYHGRVPNKGVVLKLDHPRGAQIVEFPLRLIVGSKDHSVSSRDTRGGQSIGEPHCHIVAMAWDYGIGTLTSAYAAIYKTAMRNDQNDCEHRQQGSCPPSIILSLLGGLGSGHYPK